MRELGIIGWREWVALPEFGVAAIKVKVDTGARTSSLHAFDVEIFHYRGKERVRFKIHPKQKSAEPAIEAEAELYDRRYVRDSGGTVTLRPVILTEIEALGVRWKIELTLSSRDSMGFRMLLGRQAVRNKFLVDSGRSWFGGKKGSKKKKGSTEKRPNPKLW